ncbi:hypothetical protein HAX54_008329, partial [Datura stramonium]|nr:hypothetical protein [Datura stramonium]
MSGKKAGDAAHLHIGNLGLIDYVLKSMNNVIVGGYIVHGVVNQAVSALEIDVYTDVLCLYNNLLLSFAESDVLNFPIKIVLDSKQFVKVWPFRDDPDESLL